VVKDEKWKIAYISKDHGFHDQRQDRTEEVVGAMSIRASLGDYQGLPFKANITVYWGFDVTGKLIDIWVWKTWDAP